MVSINLADKLVILLIFVNNENSANAIRKSVACEQNANADAAWAGIRSDLAKATIRVKLMVDIESAY